MRWDFPSHTIRTEFFKPEKGAYLHPQWVPGTPAPRDDPRFIKGDPKQSVDRVVTHYEASLIQDFPEDYLWVGLEDRDREADRQRGPLRPRSRDRSPGQAVHQLNGGRRRTATMSDLRE